MPRHLVEDEQVCLLGASVNEPVRLLLQCIAVRNRQIYSNLSIAHLSARSVKKHMGHTHIFTITHVSGFVGLGQPL